MSFIALYNREECGEEFMLLHMPLPYLYLDLFLNNAINAAKIKTHMLHIVVAL